MDIWHKIKKLAAKGAPRINAEAPTSHVERAIVVRWGKQSWSCGTISRTIPLPN